MTDNSTSIDNVPNNTEGIYNELGIEENDPSKILKNLRIKNINRLIIGHLNINSIANKFESLKEINQGYIDILVISETKLNESYSINMFDIDGYSTPYRYDRNTNTGGGILIYVKEDIACRELKTKSDDKSLEGIFLEINLRKSKWLLFGGYNNLKSNISTFLGCVGDVLDHHISNLENFILLGDFNSEINEIALKNFCDTYNLENLVTEATCFKSHLNPSSIDLILTNRPRSFQNTTILETGLSDHHKMTLSVLKIVVPKQIPSLIKYRDYKNFNSQVFRDELKSNLSVMVDKTCYDTFETTFKDILDKHAPIKAKIVRANNAPFMNKKLSKAIMNRSRLKNKFLKEPNKANENRYKKQRNYCVNLTRSVKKEYYSNLDIKNVTDNKKFT